jgi:hypothetical protein
VFWPAGCNYCGVHWLSAAHSAWFSIHIDGGTGRRPVISASCSRRSGGLDVSHDRGAVNIKPLGERVGRLSRLVPLDDLRNLVNRQSALLLTERSDGSSGRPVTTMTSENASQIGDDVWVGIPTISSALIEFEPSTTT